MTSQFMVKVIHFLNVCCHTCSSFMAPLAHFIKQKGAKTEDPVTFDRMDPRMFWPYLKKRCLPF